MARQPDSMPSPRILTAIGTYYFSVPENIPAQLIIKGTWGGTIAFLYFYDQQNDTYRSIANGSWTADAEVRLTPPSGQLMLELQGGAGILLTVNYAPTIIATRDK